MMKIDFNKLNIIVGYELGPNGGEAWDKELYPFRAIFFCASTQSRVDADYFKITQLMRYVENRPRPKDRLSNIAEFVSNAPLSEDELRTQWQIYVAAYEAVSVGKDSRNWCHIAQDRKQSPDTFAIPHKG